MKHSYLSKNYDTNKAKNDLKPKNLSEKFEYLVIQNRFSKVIRDHELEVLGIPQILNGLGYHFKKFTSLEKKQSPGNTTRAQFNNTINEITAYFNRLGQIYSCITSDWFQDYVKKEQLPLLCPSILALIPYRHKYAAHRSLDRPWGESQSQHESHSNIYLYNEWHGKIGDPRMRIGYQIKIDKKDRCKILTNYHPLPVQNFESFSDKEIFIDFVPTDHHNRIIHETFETLTQLFVHP